METRKRTSTRTRLLAWLMTVVMMCTSASVPTFAEEIAFDDAMTVELQGTDETTAENVEDFEVEGLDDLDYSEEVIAEGGEEEEIFDDLFQDENFYSDESVGFEGIEVVPSEDGSADAETTESELGEEEFADEYGVEAVVLDDVDAQAETTAAYTITVTADTEEGKKSVENTTFYVNGCASSSVKTTIGTPISITKKTTEKMQFRINTPNTMEGVAGLEVIIDGISVKKMNTSNKDEITTTATALATEGVFSYITVRDDGTSSKMYLYFDNTNSQMTNLMTDKNITVKYIFEDDEKPKYNLTAKINEEIGEVYATKWIKNQENGNGIFGVYVRPKNGYQLVSYTMAGQEIPLELKSENYTSWKDAGGISHSCNYFEIAIDQETEITLNLAQAEMEFKLIGYQPMESNVAVYQFGAGNVNYDILYNNVGVTKVPLIEGSGVKFFFHLQTKGYIWFDKNGKSGAYEGFKIYAGTEKSEENLLFDMNTSGAAGNDNNLGTPNEQYYGDAWEKEGYVVSGKTSRIGSVILINTPNLTQVTLEAQAYGETYTTTADVQMANDLPEVKEFTKYYTDNYGLDKMGQEAYTAEEKATDAYAKYCQYSNFRYVLRKVYQEHLLKIGSAAEEQRAAALEAGKKALDAASKGEGCNAVVWNFYDKDGTSSIPVMVAIPNNRTTSASDSMEAALEALYPGNWTYNCTATSFGAFVNSITAGNASDVGCINIRIPTDGSTGGSYGFWFYNGKFSDWGVSNYTPYDGDVMWWGGGNVEKNWAWALLRLRVGDAAIASKLTEAGTTIDKITAEELRALFPDVNFNRYGQFRTFSNVDMVEMLIGQIGTVTPDSGDDIKKARDAYDALSSQADKDAVSNYPTLLDAEAAYKALLEKASVASNTAMKKILAGMNSGTALGVGTTKGEWAILSLARRGLISGKEASGQAANYLKAAQEALASDKLSSSTDYSRVTLALSSLGVTAPEELIKQCEDYDKAISQGINAAAFALLALDSKPYDTANTAIREKYISYMLSHVCVNGGWVLGEDLSTADADVTAMVIQSLAPYYDRADVKAAVDKGLDALKTMQKVTGGFASFGTYNAESTAQVIVALTSLGIDPTTWNDHDAVDALLHFYSTSDSKFAHTLGGDVDQMATEQATYALVAYYRFKQKQSALYQMSDAFGASGSAADPVQAVASAVMAVSALGEQSIAMTTANTEDAILSYVKTTAMLLGIDGPTYEVSKKEFTAATAGTAENKDGVSGSFTVTVTISMDGAQSATVDVKGVITPSKYVDPKAPITVKFSLYGDEIHAVNGDGDLHIYQFNADTMDQWIPETNVTVPGDATVGDVFKKVLDANGFTYVGLNSNYISKITNTKKNISLAEFDNTKNSGWMYLVNGVHPNVGLNAQKLNNGDVIVWHWTDEYQLESGSEMYNSTRVISYVENLINAVAEPEGTPECKKAIEQARAAYDKLDAANQAKISNLATLEKTEATVAASDWCWHEYGTGKVTKEATCTENGTKTYTCSKCGGAKTEEIPANGHKAGAWTETKATCTQAGEKVQKCTVCGETLNKETLSATGHKFSSWTTVSEATVKAVEVQKHTCSVCGASETQNVGSKLKAVLQIPGKISSFNMKKGKTESFKVTMAKGDSVTSVKSNKTKVLEAKLDKKTGKITLKALKTGTAKLTIKLDSKTSKTYTVKVVTGTVKTTGVSVTSIKNKKLTLKAGKTHTLKTEVKPFTTTQKLTYKSSDKKVATVTSKGKIEAVAPGKATITVKSGSKSVKITVTVPGITIAKSSVTVKKNKTTILKPNAYGISGKVTYTSSNPKVATVTSKGKVKGIKKGSAKITIQAGTYTKTVTVKVK